MMLVSDIIELSVQNLRLHKTRSILTSLGVIFGVGSVIAMLSISEGAKRSALSQIEAMGIDKIIVYSKKPPVAGGAVSCKKNGHHRYLRRHVCGFNGTGSICWTWIMWSVSLPSGMPGSG